MDGQELRHPQGPWAQEKCVNGDAARRLWRCWRFSNEDSARNHLIGWGLSSYSSCKGRIPAHRPRSGNTGTAAASRPAGCTLSFGKRTMRTAKSISNANESQQRKFTLFQSGRSFLFMSSASSGRERLVVARRVGADV